MTDATASLDTPLVAAAPRAAALKLSHRAAGPADIDLVHAELMAVIDESPHYNAEFKAFEKARLTKGYLRQLLSVDPWHVMLLTIDDKPAGAIVSGPEFGAVFRYWSWVFPRYRDSKLGMHGMRAFDEVFDNGRFHKCYTFVRPENEVALLLLRRYGYKQTAILEKHLFGQDYAVMEKHYTKVVPGYDSGIGLGRLGRLKVKLNRLLGR